MCAASGPSSYRRSSSDDRPFRLFPTSVFAAASCGYHKRHGADLSHRRFSPYWVAIRRMRSRRGLGLDDIGLFADPELLWSITVGSSFAADRIGLFGVHLGFSVPALAGQGWGMEGAQSGLVSEAMTLTDLIDPSKTEHGENFPVVVAFDCGSAQNADPELLPLCARGRRYSRPSRSVRK